MAEDDSSPVELPHSPRLIPNPCCELPDSELEELRKEFGFRPGYGADLLRSGIEQAAQFYFHHMPPIKTGERKDRMTRIHKLVDELLLELGGDSLDFPDVEPIGIRGPLWALREAATQQVDAMKQSPPERGRKQMHGLWNWVLHLQFVYLHGTGRTDRYTWNVAQECYCGGLLAFISEVAPLCGISVSDSSIAAKIKELNPAGSLYDQADPR